MGKIVTDILIVGGVVVAYVFMAAFQPGTNELISVASANASANWTGFELTQNAIKDFPIYQWFIPGLCGIIGFVVNHKAK